MSQHVETVKAIYEAFGRGDVAAILARLDSDVVWEPDWSGPRLRWFASRRGRESINGFFESLADFDFVRFEPTAYLEGDGMVAVTIRIELKVRSTGKTVKDLEVHLWTFTPEGQVQSFRHVADTLQWAQATGS